MFRQFLHAYLKKLVCWKFLTKAKFWIFWKQQNVQEKYQIFHTHRVLVFKYASG